MKTNIFANRCVLVWLHGQLYQRLPPSFTTTLVRSTHIPQAFWGDTDSIIDMQVWSLYDSFWVSLKPRSTRVRYTCCQFFTPAKRLPHGYRFCTLAISSLLHSPGSSQLPPSPLSTELMDLPAGNGSSLSRVWLHLALQASVLSCFQTHL